MRTLIAPFEGIQYVAFFTIQIDPRYEVTKDVRGQIKFLEELDKAEQKRHEEQEREMLMRAAKSRSKTEDPEQAKLKAKVQFLMRNSNKIVLKNHLRSNQIGKGDATC